MRETIGNTRTTSVAHSPETIERVTEVVKTAVDEHLARLAKVERQSRDLCCADVPGGCDSQAFLCIDHTLEHGETVIVGWLQALGDVDLGEPPKSKAAAAAARQIALLIETGKAREWSG